MILDIQHTESGATLKDAQGFVRGFILAETFGSTTIYSWTYLEPRPGGLCSKSVERGSETTMELAISAIRQCANQKS